MKIEGWRKLAVAVAAIAGITIVGVVNPENAAAYVAAIVGVAGVQNLAQGAIDYRKVRNSEVSSE